MLFHSYMILIIALLLLSASILCYVFLRRSHILHRISAAIAILSFCVAVYQFLPYSLGGNAADWSLRSIEHKNASVSFDNTDSTELVSLLTDAKIHLNPFLSGNGMNQEQGYVIDLRGSNHTVSFYLEENETECYMAGPFYAYSVNAEDAKTLYQFIDSRAQSD